MAAPIRIANCSGFFGDRLSAAREMVEGGDRYLLMGDTFVHAAATDDELGLILRAAA